MIIAVIEFIFILSASFGISFFFLKKEITDNIFESIIFRIALGLGIISYLTLIAGALKFLNSFFFILILLLGNLLLVFKLKSLKKIKIDIKFSLFGLILFIFIIINFFYSLFPPTFHDSMVYHLAVPSYYIMHGGIVPWDTNFNSNLPLNVEMVYLFSLLGKTVYIPKLLSFFSGLSILLLMFCWYRRRFSRGLVLLPLILFYTIPQIGFLTSSSKTELVGMLFLFIAIRLFFYYVERSEENRLLIISGIFWGLAVGTKYTFTFFLLGFCIVLLFFKKFKFKKRVLSVLLILLLVFLCLLPWFIKNFIVTGNPTYPYLSNIFKNKFWDVEQIADFSTGFKRGYSNNLLHMLWFPIEIFFKPYKFGMTSVYGLLFLFFLPLLIFSKRSSEIRLLIFTAVIAFFFLFFFARIPRYYLPAFLLLSIPIANGVENISERFTYLRKLIFPIFGVLLLLNLILQVDLQEKFSKGFDFVSKRITGKLKGRNVKYLYALPYYSAVEYINKNLSSDDRVVLLGEDRTFYLKKKFFASSRGDQNILIELLRNSRNYQEFIEGLKREKITYILYCPTGLEQMRMRPFLYGLSTKEQKILNNGFNNFTLVYNDNKYFIYKVKIR